MNLSSAPSGVERFALSRGEAAFMAGVSVGTFDKMVADRRMPVPRVIGGRKIWLAPEVRQALLDLPEASDLAEVDARNQWDGAR